VPSVRTQAQEEPAMPAKIVKCNHADLLDSPLECFVTSDGAHVDLCKECADYLLAHLIADMTTGQFETALWRATTDEKNP
jgi:hypothetical protein